MENGVNGKHVVGEVELEVSGGPKNFEENEVFEEAMDRERFSLSKDGDSVREDAIKKENGEAEVERFEGLADGEHGAGSVEVEAAVRSEFRGEEEQVVFNKAKEEKGALEEPECVIQEGSSELDGNRDADCSVEEVEAFHESETGLCVEDDKEVIRVDGGEAESMGAYVVAETVDHGNELVLDNLEIRDLGGVELGGEDAIFHGKADNGETQEVSSNGIGSNDVTGTEELLSREVELQHIQSVPICVDTAVDKKSGGIQSANINKMDDEVKADVENDVICPDEEFPRQDIVDSVDCNCESGTLTEVGKESALVENLGDSGSCDDTENKISSQPDPSVTSNHENAGGPSLPPRPAGLGSSAPLLNPPARSVQQPPRVNGSAPIRQPLASEEPPVDDVEENRETQEKLQMIRVKFLRLAHRLGQTPHNVVVAQVLYRLGLAEQLWRNTNRTGVFSFDRASVLAEQLEATGQEPLDFSCTIMVIGKSGVGKSATINSIFDDFMFRTDAFQLSTKKVQDVVGTVQGISVRVIDTPGLSSCSSDRHQNEKILSSVKRFISKSPPDIVLYFDRLDMQSRDHGDVPLLRSITDVFGPSIWFNAIVVLTHAASAPPDGPNGSPLSYEMFVTQRSHVVQQAIRQAAGDVRLMNPVSLVENHSQCRINRAGQRVLPNGQVWKPQLLLLSFASKILAEANLLLKLQDNPPGKPFGSRSRVLPLPYLLSSLLQSRPQLKLPEEQLGEDTLDDDLDEPSDSGDEADYDELPPFKRLTKAQLEKLTKEQRKVYFEELEYREKLFFKKQLKEERERRKIMKKMAESAKDLPKEYNNENLEEESSGPASVPVPMPDLVLPTSFDSDNPTHRYRFLDSSSLWLVRPVLETQGWDHDVGYDGLNVERLFVVKDKIPISVSGQLTKDKKESTLQMELATSLKHSEGKATSFGVDVQTVGKEMMYTLRGETRLNNFKRNNTAAGLTVTLLGDTVSAGLKVEDKLILHKGFRVLMSGGAMTGRGDVAYGGRLEVTLRDKDYPIGRALSTLALSVVDWHGDLALGCNVQSQFPLGRGTNLIGHANISNRGSGQVGIRLNSSEQLQIALLALVPIFRNVKRLLFGSSQNV